MGFGGGVHKGRLAPRNRLNASDVAKLRHDISLEEHRDRCREAAVYLLALREGEVSSGQVRVMDSVRVGTPRAGTRLD
jgi:hypothetical protein